MFFLFSPDGNDYSRLAAHVGMQEHDILLIKEKPKERGSEVLQFWTQRNGRKATLKELHTILSDLQMTSLREHLESVLDNYA